MYNSRFDANCPRSGPVVPPCLEDGYRGFFWNNSMRGINYRAYLGLLDGFEDFGRFS
jgi:hypothetical protein